MAATFKVRVKHNMGTVGSAYTIFYFEYNQVGSPPDAGALAIARDWVDDIYAPLRDFMSTAYTNGGVSVDEVNDLGATVRHVGTVSCVINGNSATDPSSAPTAMSGFARTNVTKVRGSKRFPGVTDGSVVNHLLSNAAVSALAAAVAAWLSMPSGTAFYRPGVISSVANGFVPFALSGAVTNVPGTQVTRKPFRGV